jgi:MFS family permease
MSHWFPHRTSQVRWGIIGQSLAWLPMLGLPLLFPQWGPWLVVAGAALYFGSTHFTSPAWASLITDLLHANERGAYFARRSQLMAVTSFVALCLGGALLSFFEQYHRLWLGFALLFVIAGVSRSFSAISLAGMTDVPIQHEEPPSRGFVAFLSTGTSKDFRHFLIFSGLMHLAVLISGPFFVIYMLQDLHFSYWAYGTWSAASIVGQLVTLPGWGQFSDRFGNKALLTFTGILVAFLPMLYLISTAWPFLVIVNFFGGVVWAGLSLGLGNYVYDAVRPADRTKAVAVSSMVNAIGWALGTLLGSWLIGTVPGELTLGSLRIDPVSNLPFIFFISGLLRLAISLSLVRTFQELRHVEQHTATQLILELPLIKPLGRLTLRRIDPSR